MENQNPNIPYRFGSTTVTPRGQDPDTNQNPSIITRDFLGLGSGIAQLHRAPVDIRRLLINEEHAAATQRAVTERPPPGFPHPRYGPSSSRPHSPPSIPFASAIVLNSLGEPILTRPSAFRPVPQRPRINLEYPPVAPTAVPLDHRTINPPLILPPSHSLPSTEPIAIAPTSSPTPISFAPPLRSPPTTITDPSNPPKPPIQYTRRKRTVMKADGAPSKKKKIDIAGVIIREEGEISSSDDNLVDLAESDEQIVMPNPTVVTKGKGKTQVDC